MREILSNLNYYAEGFAVALTVFAAVATFLRKRIEQWLTSSKLFHARRSISLANSSSAGSDSSGGAALKKSWKTRDSALNSHTLARSHVVIRLDDAKTARTEEESTAKVSRILSGSLTFAQVVIGGVLASSFVQESLSRNTVGIFGVLVLIASLVKQQYRPEVDAEQAREKASKLQALIRLSEDQLATIDARSAQGEDRTDALIELRDRISQGITEIENPEAILSKRPDAKSLPQSGSKSTT